MYKVLPGMPVLCTSRKYVCAVTTTWNLFFSQLLMKQAESGGGVPARAAPTSTCESNKQSMGVANGDYNELNSVCR